MKIQCNVCESCEANVLCCADEAALCWSCDQKVHAANKLASKHQRVPLSTTSSHMPKCDICQETVGYFFCLEDRALLCRKCDVAIHSVNSLVSVHQRFLLTGVKVGLEAAETNRSSSSGKHQFLSNDKFSEPHNHSLPKITTPTSSVVPCNNNNLHFQESAREELNFPSSKLSVAGSSASGNVLQFDEYLELGGDFSQNYNFMDHSSSKADTSKLGDSDCSPILRASIGEIEPDDCMGLVPDSSWAVPDIPSPPTASGLQWPKNHSNISSDYFDIVPDIPSPPTASGLQWPKNDCNISSDYFDIVPDVSSLPLENYYSHHQRSHVSSSKRRRHQV